MWQKAKNKINREIIHIVKVYVVGKVMNSSFFTLHYYNIS